MAIRMDHYVHIVGVVEGACVPIERSLVEAPVRRGAKAERPCSLPADGERSRDILARRASVRRQCSYGSNTGIHAAATPEGHCPVLLRSSRCRGGPPWSA